VIHGSEGESASVDGGSGWSVGFYGCAWQALASYLAAEELENAATVGVCGLGELPRFRLEVGIGDLLLARHSRECS